MRRGLAMLALALGVFLVVLVIYLPASWVTSMLPGQVQCAQPAGSLWRGRCAQLVVAGRDFGAASWRIHPATLLRLTVGADIEVRGPQGTAHGYVESGTGGSIAARDFSADMALDPAIIPGLPANWRGSLQARLAELRVASGKFTALRGTLQAHDIIATGPSPAEFGSYELAFKDPPASDGTLRGALRDLNGPLSVQANATINQATWKVDGLVAVRPGANPVLERNLQFLGTPDANGRRPFGAEGTF